jgi:hypothetical protein
MGLWKTTDSGLLLSGHVHVGGLTNVSRRELHRGGQNTMWTNISPSRIESIGHLTHLSRVDRNDRSPQKVIPLSIPFTSFPKAFGVFRLMTSHIQFSLGRHYSFPLPFFLLV